MKLRLKTIVEYEPDTLFIEVPVRYEEEDISNDFPFRKGDMWCAYVDLKTHRVKDWPGPAGRIAMKVTDCGTYRLLCGGNEVCSIEEDYVPNSLIPGEYGDYIDLDIGADGTILNWKKDASFEDFEYRHNANI